jgi:hypothetical protein
MRQDGYHTYLSALLSRFSLDPSRVLALLWYATRLLWYIVQL